ncbi:hypothetical protein ABZ464_20080 [Streptomyces sp. NPDC005820]|uniref:hypothetical protein n=1 Tax=Streptomyces sp. NPDC005820 TaxID=3157069 RepID=UPI0033C7ECD6
MSEPTEPHGRRPDDALAAALKRAADVHDRVVPVPVARIEALGARRRHRMLATAVVCAVGVLGTAGAVAAVRLQPDTRPAAPVFTPPPSPPLTPSPSPSPTVSPSASSSLAPQPTGSGAPAYGGAPSGGTGATDSASPSMAPTAPRAEGSGRAAVSPSPDDSAASDPVGSARPSDTSAGSAAALAPASGS